MLSASSQNKVNNPSRSFVWNVTTQTKNIPSLYVRLALPSLCTCLCAFISPIELWVAWSRWPLTLNPGSHASFPSSFPSPLKSHSLIPSARSLRLRLNFLGVCPSFCPRLLAFLLWCPRSLVFSLVFLWPERSDPFGWGGPYGGLSHGVGSMAVHLGVLFPSTYFIKYGGPCPFIRREDNSILLRGNPTSSHCLYVSCMGCM